VLVKKLALPPYTAVMEWLPLFKFEIEKVAWPDAFKVLEPSDLVPSLKVTVPVGTAVPGALPTTVAVKVTDWPLFDGLSEGVTVQKRANHPDACRYEETDCDSTTSTSHRDVQTYHSHNAKYSRGSRR